MVNIKYKNWEQIPLGKYNEILETIKDYQEDQELETEIKIISILSDISENELWNTPIEHLRGIRNQISFVYSKPEWKNHKVKSIKIGKYDCNCVYDMEKVTIAQYVDFQNYIHMNRNVNAEILSTFIIPKGHRYGEDYDLNDLIRTIKNELPVGIAVSIFDSFVRTSAISIDSMIFSKMIFLKLMRWPRSLKQYKKRVLKLMQAGRKNLQEMYGFHSLI